MPKRAEITVSGRVQGVGYRFFAVRKANELKLTGYAQNKPDGSVYIIAEGDEGDIKTFIDWLQMGSPLSHVKKIMVDWFDISNRFANFTVKY